MGLPWARDCTGGEMAVVLRLALLPGFFEMSAPGSRGSLSHGDRTSVAPLLLYLNIYPGIFFSSCSYFTVIHMCSHQTWFSTYTSTCFRCTQWPPSHLLERVLLEEAWWHGSAFSYHSIPGSVYSEVHVWCLRFALFCSTSQQLTKQTPCQLDSGRVVPMGWRELGCISPFTSGRYYIPSRDPAPPRYSSKVSDFTRWPGPLVSITSCYSLDVKTPQRSMC